MKIIGHIVDVVRRDIYDGVVVVEGGKIAEVTHCELPPTGKAYPYLMPGFIDSHVHIESSMMEPHEFARVAVGHGTIGAVADPHEICNVMGVEGLDYMVRSGKQATMNICFGVPSCVPAVGGDIETSGAVLDADDIERLLARDDIGFLGEVMNYVGVLNGDEQLMKKIAAAKRHGKPVDGHAPGLLGIDRVRYASAGITTDHECATLEEGLACIKAGMKVLIREGSAAKDFDNLESLIGRETEHVMFCTDDCHPNELVRGHINNMVKRAIADGYDLFDILQVACVNPQRHYRLNWGLLQVGDPATFIVVNNIGPHFRVQHTFVNGVEVFSFNSSSGATYSHAVANDPVKVYPNRFVATPITAADIPMDINSGDTVNIINAFDGSLITRREEVTLTGNPLIDALYPWPEVQKIVVYNRYTPGAKPVVGLVRGFGLRDCAIASTVAHDCHNIVAIGLNNDYLVSAINRVVEMQGGLVVVSKDEMLDLALPIGGLMSPLSGHEVAYRSRIIREMVAQLGCKMKSPFITMAFMCLPVIPELKITDRCLLDSTSMTPVPQVTWH